MALYVSNTSLSNGIIINDSNDLYARLITANGVTETLSTASGSAAYNVNSSIGITNTANGRFRNIFYNDITRKARVGLIRGYTIGGITPPGGAITTISRFPFASSGVTTTDVGNATTTVRDSAKHPSTTHGYHAGGSSSPNVQLGTIGRFSFAAEGTGTSVGNLSQSRSEVGGTSDFQFAYSAGGVITPSVLSRIDRFPFAATTNATSTGNLNATARNVASYSGLTDGYVTGGTAATPNPANFRQGIRRYPFAATSNATSIGNLALQRYNSGGNSSRNHGYIVAGIAAPAPTATMEIFPFVASTNSTSIGNLSPTLTSVATDAADSREHGYLGGQAGTPAVKTLARFPFSTAPGITTSSIGNWGSTAAFFERGNGGVSF